jgi:regulator of sigma E protease
MSWLIVIAGFCVLIILHEAGHFAVAKWVGMRVEKFSLFFPPTIWSKKKGETEYAIGVIPAGGYVRISGMNPSEDLPEEVRDRAYHAQPVWKRMAVIAAGPAVNFALAFVLLLVFYTSVGPRDATSTVGTAQKGWPAYGKLRPGDRLVAVDGKPGDPLALSNRIATHKCAGTPVKGCKAATPVRITVLRDGKRLTYTFTPRYDPAAKKVRIGFAFDFKRQPYSLGKSVDTSASTFWFITRETVKLPAYIFNSEKRSQISGIVGVSDTTHKAIANDFGDGIFLFAVISLSLAIINLFPFLPLDGGHIFWAAVEFVRRRPVPYAVMERAGMLGFVLVIGLFLLGLTNDIDRLTSGTGPR